jgi:spermidine synthase
MKPWIELGRARAPGGGELTLHQRDREFVIRVDGAELMSSRVHGSEEALAEVGIPTGAAAPRVLVGGLGMGFTLRAALDAVPARGEVVVAEISDAVVEWNRGPLAELAGAPLADRRVAVHVGDVGEAIRGGRFDAILLDVDNSPHALTRPGNDALYSERGLAAARKALRPGGRLAVWSAVRAPAFERRLRRGGYQVSVHSARARGDRGGASHVIYVGVVD